jgi:hypothetical protein
MAALTLVDPEAAARARFSCAALRLPERWLCELPGLDLSGPFS